MGVDYRQLREMQKQLEGIQKDKDAFMSSCAKELAARLLRLVIKTTPVGQYPKGSGKTGGTLKRGWTSVGDLKVEHVGDSYVIEISNSTPYASYVEFGHRTKGGKGWVKGRFMMTIAEKEIQNAAPKILEKKIRKYLEDAFK